MCVVEDDYGARHDFGLINIITDDTDDEGMGRLEESEEEEPATEPERAEEADEFETDDFFKMLELKEQKWKPVLTRNQRRKISRAKLETHRKSENLLKSTTINRVESQPGKWRKMTACVDSGAVRSVAPKIVAPGVSLVATDESKSGKVFRAANGSPIKI